MKPYTLSDVINTNYDANVTRLWLAHNIGEVFTFGGEQRAYKKALRIANKFACILGLSVEEVIEMAKFDWCSTGRKFSNID